MRNKKKKRRLKRIKDNNRKTVGLGWDTQKTSRRGPDKKEELSLWQKFLKLFK